MKAAILFSGGKDSTYAAYLAKKAGYKLTCLLTMYSENKDSYMFHTPSITKTEKQAEVMQIPLIVDKTLGEKEKELVDLTRIIKTSIKKYNIDTLVTGALHSDYQAKRIQKICDELNIKCFNPLWHKDQLDYLHELIENNFEIIIIGVAAYPLDDSWLGRKLDKDFIKDIQKLSDKYKLHVAGEGGETESFVLNCPLFKKPLKVIDSKITGEKNSYKMEINVK